jgi:HD-like signal output (HDOD) protein
MGLWNWLVEKLTDVEPPPPARRGGQTTGAGTCEGQAVAVLEEKPRPAAGGDPGNDGPWWAPTGDTLTEPVEAVRPELSTEGRAMENLLISHFDGHDLRLPPLLHVAEAVLPKLGDPGCDLGTVGRLLSEDQVVAAAVLRMANSPLYRGLNKITALRPAITRLGVRALRTLLMHESLRAAMFTRRGAGHAYARDIWRRALASACIMHGLSDFVDIDKEDASLIGLLHDIGNVMVLRIVLGDRLAPRYEIDTATFDYLCHECHQEFGELIADAWSLPAELKAIIADHHQPPSPDDPLRTPRLLVELTDMINALLGYTQYQPYDLRRSRAAVALGLPDNDRFVNFLTTLPDQVCEMVDML